MSPQPGDSGINNTEPISVDRAEVQPSPTPAGPVSG
jgi:hypothetical protein